MLKLKLFKKLNLSIIFLDTISYSILLTASFHSLFLSNNYYTYVTFIAISSLLFFNTNLQNLQNIKSFYINNCNQNNLFKGIPTFILALTINNPFDILFYFSLFFILISMVDICGEHEKKFEIKNYGFFLKNCKKHKDNNKELQDIYL